MTWVLLIIIVIAIVLYMGYKKGMLVIPTMGSAGADNSEPVSDFMLHPETGRPLKHGDIIGM